MQVSFGNDFIFKLDTLMFDEVQRQSPQRWSTHERVGQRPALQNLGPGVDTTTLPGAVFDCWLEVGNPRSLNDLYAIKESGVPRELWHMVDRTMAFKSMYNPVQIFTLAVAERYLPGRWVITDIAENRSHFDGNGGAKQTEWTLSLSRYD